MSLGWNTVNLKYLTPYNKNKTGLHTYTDGQDNNQYLYSQFEVYSCFRVFPSFDQPSLKAKMELSVICPREWEAISNGIEERYDYEFDEAKRTKGAQRMIERHDIAWMLDFYDKESEQISVATFE